MFIRVSLFGWVPLFVRLPIDRDRLINVAQPLYHLIPRDEALHGLRVGQRLLRGQQLKLLRRERVLLLALLRH